MKDKKELYFDYKGAPYFPSKWGLYLPVFIEICVILTESIMNQSAYFQVLMIPMLLYYIYKILEHKEDIDKETETKIVSKQLTKAINQLCKDTRESVIAKEYFIITPKEPYLRNKRFMLVVMSNGEVYRFGVEHAESDGYILQTTPTLCTKEDELLLVKKYTKRFNEDKKARAKKTLEITTACILIVGVVIIVLTLWLTSKGWARIVSYLLLAGFFLSLMLTRVLNRFEDKSNLGGAIYKAAYWNIQVWWLFIQLTFPSMLLLMGLLIIIVLPFGIVYAIGQVLSTMDVITIQTALFVSLSIGAIVSAHYSKPLFAWLAKLLTANGHRYEKFFTEMVEYVYQPANIDFLVNFLYVAYLIISTIYRFQMGGKPLFRNDMDMAVLESFLVFIAFSNMRRKRDSASFSLLELFRIMYCMWTTHDNIEEDLKDEEKYTKYNN